MLSFIALYRLNKTAFRMVHEETDTLICKIIIPDTLRLLRALRFLAVVSFQVLIANDINLSMGCSTLYKML